MSLPVVRNGNVQRADIVRIIGHAVQSAVFFRHREYVVSGLMECDVPERGLMVYRLFPDLQHSCGGQNHSAVVHRLFRGIVSGRQRKAEEVRIQPPVVFPAGEDLRHRQIGRSVQHRLIRIIRVGKGEAFCRRHTGQPHIQRAVPPIRGFHREDSVLGIISNSVLRFGYLLRNPEFPGARRVKYDVPELRRMRF